MAILARRPFVGLEIPPGLAGGMEPWHAPTKPLYHAAPTGAWEFPEGSWYYRHGGPLDLKTAPAAPARGPSGPACL